MDRRSFLKHAGAAGFLTGVGSSGAATQAVKAPSKRPSGKSSRSPRQAILLITDSVRRDMLNCYKQSGLQTPNLDRLAASGVRFNHAYTTQPVCTPARSAIFTGSYPHINGCWANSLPLGETEHTLGQRLSDHGIHCGYIGKWHLDGTDYFGTGKAAPGWDASVWYDQRDYLQELSTADRKRSRDADESRDPDLHDDFTFAYRCSSRAVEFLEKHRNEDFFLVVSYDEPHEPSIAPERYRALYEEYSFPRTPDFEDNLKGKPEEQRLWAGDDVQKEIRPVREASFFGSMTFVDAQIGRVLDAIDRHTAGAMVVYTSDHGTMLQAHHMRGKGPAMYDPITNVPLLARWPGHAPTNVAADGLASHIDLSGTFLEFFGAEVPKVFQGGSMLSAIQDPSKPARESVFIEWGRYEVDHDGFGGFMPIRCIRQGKYKLSVHLLTTDELYDLEADPFEMTNLINSTEHAANRNRLHDALLAWMDQTRDPFRGYHWGRRPWRQDFPASYENSGMTRQRDEDGYLARELDYDTGLPMTKATRSKASTYQVKPEAEKAAKKKQAG